jgi:hypothetical protein
MGLPGACTSNATLTYRGRRNPICRISGVPWCQATGPNFSVTRDSQGSMPPTVKCATGMLCVCSAAPLVLLSRSSGPAGLSCVQFSAPANLSRKVCVHRWQAAGAARTTCMRRGDHRTWSHTANNAQPLGVESRRDSGACGQPSSQAAAPPRESTSQPGENPEPMLQTPTRKLRVTRCSDKSMAYSRGGSR